MTSLTVQRNRPVAPNKPIRDADRKLEAADQILPPWAPWLTEWGHHGERPDGQPRPR
jgi:hypothetical protein